MCPGWVCDLTPEPSVQPKHDQTRDSEEIGQCDIKDKEMQIKFSKILHCPLQHLYLEARQGWVP